MSRSPAQVYEVGKILDDGALQLNLEAVYSLRSSFLACTNRTDQRTKQMSAQSFYQGCEKGDLIKVLLLAMIHFGISRDHNDVV